MKKLLFAILILMSASAYSQSGKMNDYIVKTTGDTLWCNITLVNDNNIFFEYADTRNRTKSAHILKSSVKTFSDNGAPSYQLVSPSQGEFVSSGDALAGDALISSANNFGSAIIVSVAGYAISTLLFIYGAGNPVAALAIAVATSVTTVVLVVTAIKRLKTAGIILKENKL